MLHTEGGELSKKGFSKLIVCIAVLLSVVAGCSNNNLAFFDDDVVIDNFDTCRINNILNSLSRNDRDTIAGDRLLRIVYDNPKHLYWIDRKGVKENADRLISVLQDVGSYGFVPEAFLGDTLKTMMAQLRADTLDADIDTLMLAACTEYALTKAYFRYAVGVKYGFVNPKRVMNRFDLDRRFKSKGATRYRQLFDIELETADSAFVSDLLENVDDDNLTEQLIALHPDNRLYKEFKKMLADTTLSCDDRVRVMVNMERCRWKGTNPDYTTDRYVVVNIPAYQLYAYDSDSVMTMRIGCGTTTNKTPLIASRIKWMEVNPEWVIPMTIIKTEVASRAGDSAYFAKNRYFIVDKDTKDTLAPQDVTRSMLCSGRYKVAQRSGPGNSLGRLVFRFPNNLAIYLHDTSSPGFFKRDRRTVSHGCVRIQRPFDFAKYLLGEKDEWLLDRIRLSIDMKPETDKGKKYLKEHEEDSSEGFRLVKRVDVKPEVPVYIMYYTLYFDENNNIAAYEDVYGYDKLIYRQIKPLIGK